MAAFSSKYTNTTPSLPIQYHDRHMLVINKPRGVLSQQDHTNDPDVFNLCKQHLSYTKDGTPYLALLHRLDRPVGGLMVLGKTRDAARDLSRQIKDGIWQKSYYAVVNGKPADNGVLAHYLVKDDSTNTVRASNQTRQGAKYAELAYQRLASNESLSLIEIHLLTGRSHQIRVQFSYEGFPIWGDQKYGQNAQTENKGSIALLAQSITLYHPLSRKEMQFSLSLPESYPWNTFHKQ